jgi:AAA+ superfamily predicted ATPase
VALSRRWALTGRTISEMNELEKLLATRSDARVAVIGLAAVVSKYVGETEKNIERLFDNAERSGAILFYDESDDLFGKRDEIEQHDGPVVIGARSIESIPDELRKGLVIVKAPRPRWWRSG